MRLRLRAPEDPAPPVRLKLRAPVDDAAASLRLERQALLIEMERMGRELAEGLARVAEIDEVLGVSGE